MKYKNFDDFFSSIDINKNEMIDNWENLKKRKKKITIITTIVMITIILSLFYLICYNTKLIRLIIPMFILFVIIITKLINTESKISKEIIKSNQEYKEKIIEKMLQNFIDELDYIPLKEMPSDIFDEANYGGYYNSYVSDDYFEGKINNQNIKMADLLVQRITVEKDKDGNEEKKVMTIFGGLFGKNATDKKISWESSDESIAMINEEGKLVAKGAGTVDITATMSNGKTSTIKVNVKEKSTVENNTIIKTATNNQVGNKEETIGDKKEKANPLAGIIGLGTLGGAGYAGYRKFKKE